MLRLDVSEVPRLYRFTVYVDGELYGESTTYLYEGEQELMAERVEEVVVDSLLTKSEVIGNVEVKVSIA